MSDPFTYRTTGGGTAIVLIWNERKFDNVIWDKSNPLNVGTVSEISERVDALNLEVGTNRIKGKRESK